jgi:hypothetical protein
VFNCSTKDCRTVPTIKFNRKHPLCQLCTVQCQQVESASQHLYLESRTLRNKNVTSVYSKQPNKLILSFKVFNLLLPLFVTLLHQCACMVQLTVLQFVNTKTITTELKLCCQPCKVSDLKSFIPT